MELVIFGHILGDFYIQTDKIADKKKKSAWYMLLHCFFYMIVMYIVLLVLTGDFIQSLMIAVIIGLSHICVDIIKVKVDLKTPKYEYVVFLLDQAIHIVFLILICFLFKIQFNVDRYSSLQLMDNISFHKMITILIAGLICSKPTALFISLVFKAIPKTVEDADREEQECDKEEQEDFKKTNKGKNAKNINEKNVEYEEIIKIGSWIGILEREIILLLGLLGQYGAIGFVLAAKSLARYKQLEKKAFAEKYLVGTLLSTLIAIACLAIYSLVK
ncbi:DUF3307 domain-containing protein [[Clostridium] fimetarium]|uniref:DUF3307 domain-containing protein n=1 Tax=[Clostridium] fimetarium TaxID=99656 RepID=A0A1I0NR19_9FIRM|nr:DUF3307 domain-containing protein [[Clostridium] fimetarium]SEW03890.1 Protein of unknown function [[Clostridium] fimetarium]